MSKDNLANDYQLIFEGLRSTSPEIIANLRSILIDRFGLSTYAVEVFFKKPPIVIRRSQSRSELQEYKLLLENAGAIISLSPPEDSSESSSESESEISLELTFEDANYDLNEAGQNDVEDADVDALISSLESATLKSEIPIPTIPQPPPTPPKKMALEDLELEESPSPNAVEPNKPSNTNTKGESAPKEAQLSSKEENPLLHLQLDDALSEPEEVAPPINPSESDHDDLELSAPETSSLIDSLVSDDTTEEDQEGGHMDLTIKPEAPSSAPESEPDSLEFELEEKAQVKDASQVTSKETPPSTKDSSKSESSDEISLEFDQGTSESHKPEGILDPSPNSDEPKSEIEAQPKASKPAAPKKPKIPDGGERSAEQPKVARTENYPTAKDDEPEFRPPLKTNTPPRTLSLTYLVALLGAVLALGVVNWQLLSGSGNAGNRTTFNVDAILKADAARAAKSTKKIKKAPAPTPSGPLKEWVIHDVQEAFIIDGTLVTQGNSITHSQLELSTKAPPELTPLEIVNGKIRDPWVRKAQLLALNPKPSKEKVIALGDAKLSIDYNGRTSRVVAKVTLEGEINSDGSLLSLDIKLLENTTEQSDSGTPILVQNLEPKGFKIFLHTQTTAKEKVDTKTAEKQ